MKVESTKISLKKKDDSLNFTQSQEHSVTSSQLNGSSYFSRDSNILFANKSLCFSKDSKFRYLIQRIITTKIFIHTIDLIIIANCFFLILETIDKFEIYSDYFHNFFTIIFIIECILKIIAFGFFMEEYSYLRDPWNWIDFIIVITGVLYFIPHFKLNVNSIGCFRLLRPLKVLSSIPSMRKFIHSLINCFYDLIDIIIIICFVFFFFALLGYAIFDNRFNFICRTTLIPIEGDLPIDPLYSNYLCGGEITCGNKLEYCLNTWDFYYEKKYFIPHDFPFENPNFYENEKKKIFNYGLTNFNNIFSSLFIVCIISTSEGWVNLMFMMMDGYNYYVSLIYFIFCLFVNHYFMLNLITALLLYNFNKERDDIEISISISKRGKKKKNKIKMTIGDINLSDFNQSNGSSIYSKESHSKIDVNLNINSNSLTDTNEMNKIKRKYKRINFNRNIKRSTTAFYVKIVNFFIDIKWIKKTKKLSKYHNNFTFGYYCYVIVQQPIVQKIFYLCIILNSVVYAFERKGISEKEQKLHDKFNTILVCFFVIDIILSLFAYSIKEYFHSYYNIFDCIIVFISFIEIIFKESKIISEKSSSSESSVLTCLRMIRIFQLLRKWESFNIILDSIKRTIIRMMDFLFIFCIFIFIFTLLGQNFFNNSLKYKNDRFYAQADSEYYNFDNLINSLVCVIIIIVGDHWTDLLFDLYRSDKNNKVEVIIYFFFIVLFGQIILIKIFLAHLIEQFDLSKKHFEKNFTVHDFLLDTIYYSSSVNINCTSKIKPIDSQILLYLKGISQIKPNYSLSESFFELINKIEINFITHKKKKIHVIGKHFSEHILRHGGYYEEMDNMKIFNFDDVVIKPTNNIQVELFYNDELDKIDYYDLSNYNLEETSILEESNSISEISFSKNEGNKYTKIENIVLEEIENENEIENPIITNDKLLRTIKQDEMPSIKETDYDIVSIPNDQKSSNKNNRSILSSFTASRNITLTSINSIGSKYSGLFSVGYEYSFDEDSNYEEKSFWEKFYNYISKASCFIIGKNWKIRKKIHDFVYNKYISYIIFVLIVTNTILICFDNPWLDPKSNFAKFSKKANQCYTCIFVCNLTLKMISDGVIFDKNAYLRNLINIIDCFCCVIGVLGFFNVMTQYRYLRALRSIKPIRILIRSENLSLMMETIIASIPAMINLIIFIFLYIYTFTLLGINIFKGILVNVCDNDYSLQTEKECLDNGGHWIFNRENYANFFYGLKSTFELILKDEWVQEMQVAGMKTGSKWVWLYYIIVMFIGNIFLLNMILAVIIQEFRTLKAKKFHFALLNDAEKNWIQTQKIIMKFHPKKKFLVSKEKKIVDYLYLFFESNGYYIYMVCNVIISIIAFLFRLNHLSKKTRTIFIGIDYSCEFLLTVEVILKIWVYGREFFHNKWNIFDFIIAILIDLSIPIDFINWESIFESTIDAVPLSLRFLRLFELVKILAKDGRMRALFDTLLYELPSLGNVVVFASFIFLIYGNVGMNVFAQVPFRKKINRNSNFRNFLSSCLTLLQVTTGEDWNELMNELAYHDCRDPSSEIYRHDYYCINYNVTCFDEKYINYTSMSKLGRFSCGHSFSYAFFISFVIICPVFIMNLCVVMVVQGFEESVFENEGILPLEYIEQFISLWEEYDPYNTKVIKPYEFVLIMKELQPPVGYNYDRNLVSNNFKSRREKKEYMEFQSIVNQIKEKVKKEKEDQKLNNYNIKNTNLINIQRDKNNNNNIIKPLKIKNSFKKENSKIEFESNISPHQMSKINENTLDNQPSTFRQFHTIENFNERINFNKLSSTSNNIYPFFTEEYPKNKIYVSKNLKFYTSDIEIIQLMYKYNILAYDIYKKDHTGSGYNYNISKEEEEKFKKIHQHIENKGCDDLYIHFIDALFSVSKYAVSISQNVSLKKLRRNEVCKYSKKMWEAEYDKKYIKPFFLNIERREENFALSKKLSAKRIIDLYNFYKARKEYYNKISVIRKKNLDKKAKKLTSVVTVYSMKSFDYQKRISIIRNRRRSSIVILNEQKNFRRESVQNPHTTLNPEKILKKKSDKVNISISNNSNNINTISENKSFVSDAEINMSDIDNNNHNN
jgi:hypothetical protein